jgi:hypothetical protein
MSDEQQPRAEWIFPEQKKSNKGRIWLIVGLSVLALAIVGTLLFFLVPRDGGPVPTPSPTDSASATPTPSATPTATPTPTPTPTPTAAPSQEPQTTPPPVPDPDIPTFAAQVQPLLDDGNRGLGMLSDLSGQDAVLVLDTLQQDTERLSDAAAPSSIASEWQSAVSDYAARLGALREAFENGSETQAPMNEASAALQGVRSLVGL